MPSGFADLHNHQFAHLAYGGRMIWGQPWGDPQSALADCRRRHGLWGYRDIVGHAFGFATSRRPPWHRTSGAPSFRGWPRWHSYTHQMVHEDMLRRAVDGGLRLMVMLASNNEWLSRRILRVPPDCADDMAAVNRQISAAWAMQRRVDTRCGGRGTGWYRICRSPEEAERVIAEGKLAVVLGIEVDHLFGCRREGDLSRSDLAARLDRYYARGVRHVFPVHFGDNGFSGGSFDNPLIRAADGPCLSRRNPLGTLGVYPVRTEDARAEGYAYRTGRRNRLGLTETGRGLVDELSARGMIIDINHMSLRAMRDTLAICAPTGYPVVAGHTGFLDISRGARRHEKQLTADELERIHKLGGMVGVILDQGGVDQLDTYKGTRTPEIPHRAGATSNSVIQAYLYAIDHCPGMSVALGSDFNGFAAMPAPRFDGKARRAEGAADDRTMYPFVAAATSLTMNRSELGSASYDINVDGVAHVGMLPDLVADMAAQGLTAEHLAPLLDSAAGYVAMWSRATAIAPGIAARIAPR